MHAIYGIHGQRHAGRGIGVPKGQGRAPKALAKKQIGSPGTLYAHALAIKYEAEARYREFGTHMADCGNDSLAELFGRLAEFEAEHAFLLAKKSRGIEIPIITPGEYAWLECGPLAPEARAFIFRMMTPRLALEIALRAKRQAKAFFERVTAESRNARVRALAAEFAGDEQSRIDLIAHALEQLPPIAENEELV
ncbi:MAG: ferritin family protein [Betaproteobacteria bacterium]|nr:ferritin family protein [Betaproteobacteria bacterium]